MAITITADHHAQMQENGYTIFPTVFSLEDMADLAHRLETFEQRANAALKSGESMSSISRPDEITFTDHIAERDEVVADFTKRPEFVALCQEFLGPNADLYWNQTVFKHPEGTREFPWHQDDAYTPVEPAPYLTVWLAINDATVENGCISVMPGSHADGLKPHQPSPIGLVCYPNDAENQGVQVPIPAGSLAVFWSLTMHKSGPNSSKGIRKAYVIQYSHSPLTIKATGETAEGLIPICRG